MKNHAIYVVAKIERGELGLHHMTTPTMYNSVCIIVTESYWASAVPRNSITHSGGAKCVAVTLCGHLFTLTKGMSLAANL
jgi:hypothetical protein